MIVAQTKKIMTKAIDRYAEVYGVDKSNVQLMIRPKNNEFAPTYDICKEYRKVEEVTFSQILNIKLDFLGREMIATPFIKNSLVRMSKETQTNWKDINVIIYYNNTKDDILMYLFTNKQPNKPITFEYLFGEDY